MLPEKKWKILNHDTNRSIIDIILENRGLPPNHMDAFRLTERLHSPYLLPDMEKGVKRILSAIKNEEKIFVFGDYDVDGITSTSLMIYFFRQIGYPLQYRLPHREKDGYGLRAESAEAIAALGANLIITVDNGISANEAVERAAEHGVDVVITDHHLQEGDLPKAAAVINPNRTDSEYPFKSICGVTVAFKLIQALAEKLMPEADYKQFLLNHLDLVAIGTIADVMPMRDENYALAKFGLKVLSRTLKPGVIALKNISGVKQQTVTPISVGFFLGPRLNAAGRMETADKSVELLISESAEEAGKLAAYLNDLNKSRQQLQSSYIDQALNQLPTDVNGMGKTLFVEDKKWQAGLIGLVAGNLKERFNRPVFAFTIDKQGDYVGSARSIDAFHITNALTKFKSYFSNYGGHQKAAGLTVHADKYKTFKQEFSLYAEKMINDEDLIPELVIDSIVDVDQVNLNTARNIQEVGPFGETNPEPLLLIEKAQIRDIITLSNGKHLKLYIQKDNQDYECVWWNAGSFRDSISFSGIVSIVFRLGLNNWRGADRLQLTIEDLHSADY